MQRRRAACIDIVEINSPVEPRTSPEDQDQEQEENKSGRPLSVSAGRCDSALEMRKRTICAWGAAIVCFVVLMIVTPAIPQSEEYHDFADQREFFGIPNTLNVVSNFPFLVVGLVGLVLCYYGNYFKLSLRGELWGWTFFFVGVAAVAFGSSYYHLKPDDARLVWDRLPMTVAFTSIVAIFIIERIDQRKGTVSIIPLLMAGILSILYWRQDCFLCSSFSSLTFCSIGSHGSVSRV